MKYKEADITYTPFSPTGEYGEVEDDTFLVSSFESIATKEDSGTKVVLGVVILKDGTEIEVKDAEVVYEQVRAALPDEVEVVPPPTFFDVYLGGTENDSTWRDMLVPKVSGVRCYIPSNPDWDKDALAREQSIRRSATLLLFTYTPRQQLPDLAAEVILAAVHSPERVVFCVKAEDFEAELFTKAQSDALGRIGQMVLDLGGAFIPSFDDLPSFLRTRLGVKK
jgi:hypothetical protein